MPTISPHRLLVLASDEVDRVYGGIISLVIELSEGQGIEASIIGREHAGRQAIIQLGGADLCTVPAPVKASMLVRLVSDG